WVVWVVCCFFQAEDGIRDWSVTGVQTCALPISLPALRGLRRRRVPLPPAIVQTFLTLLAAEPDTLVARRHGARVAARVSREAGRSEERRGGEGGGTRGGPEQCEKNGRRSAKVGA